MGFVFDRFSKSFEQKEVLRDANFHFEEAKFMDFWARTEPVRPRS